MENFIEKKITREGGRREKIFNSIKCWRGKEEEGVYLRRIKEKKNKFKVKEKKRKAKEKELLVGFISFFGFFDFIFFFDFFDFMIFFIFFL